MWMLSKNSTKGNAGFGVASRSYSLGVSDPRQRGDLVAP